MTKEELIKLSRENLRTSKQGSLCECYDEAFIKGYELSKKRIAELEKENAELKEELEEADNATDCFNRQEEIITKAKELLRYYFDCFKNDNKYTLSDFEVVEDTEQFLSEVEK